MPNHNIPRQCVYIFFLNPPSHSSSPPPNFFSSRTLLTDNICSNCTVVPLRHEPKSDVNRTAQSVCQHFLNPSSGELQTPRERNKLRTFIVYIYFLFVFSKMKIHENFHFLNPKLFKLFLITVISVC